MPSGAADMVIICTVKYSINIKAQILNALSKRNLKNISSLRSCVFGLLEGCLSAFPKAVFFSVFFSFVD